MYAGNFLNAQVDGITSGDFGFVNFSKAASLIFSHPSKYSSLKWKGLACVPIISVTLSSILEQNLKLST
jgi:hypothetical protein